jgi:hypothetical protein
MKTSSWPGRRLRSCSGLAALCACLLLCPGRPRAQQAAAAHPAPAIPEGPRGQTLGTAPIDPGPPPDAALLHRLDSTRKELVSQHLQSARRLSGQHQDLAAVRSLAAAYVYHPDPEVLLQLALACRRAELDHEAAAAYQQLLAAAPEAPHRATIEEELKTLAEKIEDMETSVPQRLREHLDSAKRAFQIGQFTVAAQEYSLVYALKALPRLLFNIAQSHRRAGHMQEAYLAYMRFLEQEPQTPLRKETNGYLSEIRPVAFGKPVHRRPWFWAVVGAAATTVIVVTAGGVVGAQRRDPATDGGTFQISFGLQR